MKNMDGIEREYADMSNSIACLVIEVFANAIKHDFRSKNPTTRWADIIKLR